MEERKEKRDPSMDGRNRKTGARRDCNGAARCNGVQREEKGCRVKERPRQDVILGGASGKDLRRHNASLAR